MEYLLKILNAQIDIFFFVFSASKKSWVLTYHQGMKFFDQSDKIKVNLYYSFKEREKNQLLTNGNEELKSYNY